MTKTQICFLFAYRIFSLLFTIATDGEEDNTTVHFFLSIRKIICK